MRDGLQQQCGTRECKIAKKNVEKASWIKNAEKNGKKSGKHFSDWLLLDKARTISRGMEKKERRITNR